MLISRAVTQLYQAEISVSFIQEITVCSVQFNHILGLKCYSRPHALNNPHNTAHQYVMPKFFDRTTDTYTDCIPGLDLNNKKLAEYV